jgi:hypothetical protein
MSRARIPEPQLHLGREGEMPKQKSKREIHVRAEKVLYSKHQHATDNRANGNGLGGN